MKDIKDLVKISEGFTYSINIKYDLNNIEKLNTYIPTDKTIGIIRNFSINNNGAYMIIGSYGTGKSHLLAVISNIMSGNYKPNDYDGILKKLKNRDEEIYTLLSKRIKNKTKRLVVLPNYEAQNFPQAILIGLKEALERESIDDIVINSYFSTAESKIMEWGKEFKDTYNLFFQILKNEFHINENEFFNGINKFDKNYYDLFLKIYPKVTSGSVFIPFNNNDICQILNQISNEIKPHGYEGMDIIFDEFGYFIEKNIDNIDIKIIQDIAELTNSDEISLSLYVIAHKDFSQYSNYTSEKSVSEWRKVEGRFKTYYIYQDAADVYELISRVIIKDKNNWNRFYENRNNEFINIQNETMSLPTFQEINENIIKTYIINGCFPLAPLSAFALYKLSDKLAQSQRTLFTFLSINENNSLLEIINRDKTKNYWITGDAIFDYFENLMWSESKDSEIYKVWKDTINSINKLQDKDEIKKKIIKVIGLIYIINDFDKAKPNCEFIKFFLIGNDDIQNKIDELVTSKIIFYRKSTDTYRFFEGSDINIEEEINKFININKDKINMIEILNKYFLPIPMQPRKYNDDYRINRYLIGEFILCRDLNEQNLINILSKDYIDGKVYYAIPENQQEIKKVVNSVGEFSEIKNLIIIVPKVPLNFKNDINDYYAILELLKDEEFLSKDSLLKNELQLYKDDKKQKIENTLEIILNNNYNDVLVLNGGNIKAEIKSKFELQQIISEIISKYYNKTPVFNNEMINRNYLTTIMKKVVENVIDNYFDNKLNNITAFNEFSAENTAFKSILLNTSILAYENDELKECYQLINNLNPIKDIFNEINSFLNNTKQNEVNFIEIFSKLKRAPYGLKDGVIPFLVAVGIKPYKENIYIKKDDKYEDLNGKLLIDMIRNPKGYLISIDLWDKEKEDYIKSLEDLFKDFIDINYRKKNRLSALYNGLKSYYMDLPKFTRTTSKLPDNTKKIRDILSKDFNNYKNLFFKILPQDSTYENALNVIKKSKSEMDKFIENFKKEFSQSLIEVFNPNSKDCYEAISVWVNTFDRQALQHVYDLKTNLFIKYIIDNNRSQDFLNGLIKTLTGFEVDYLSDEISLSLLEKINILKISIENHASNNLRPDIVIEYRNENVVKSFNKVKLCFLQETLKNKIKKDIDNMGMSISEEEIRTIIIDILQEYV